MAPRKQADAAVLHAIAGTDSYLAEAALERLLHAHVGDERHDAVEVLRGEETTWSRILDTARSRSLFVQRRAVVVRGADGLKGEDAGLEAYLADPTPGVCLILMAGKPDKRRAVWRLVLERAALTPADPLRGRALRSYLADRLRERGLRLGEGALEELLEQVGQDLRRLMGEVAKLEAFAAGSKQLSADEVAAVLGRGLASPLYRLSDAFVQRRLAKVLELLQQALEDGEPPVLLLGTLFRALRQVRAARVLDKQRARQEEIASRLRVQPFKVAELLAAARTWPEARLRAALMAFARADRLLKKGGEPATVLSGAVLEACGCGATGA